MFFYSKARIKAKPLIRMTYPRNGYVKRYAQPQIQPPAPPEQPPAQQQFQVPQQITLFPNVQQYLQNGNQVRLGSQKFVLNSKFANG